MCELLINARTWITVCWGLLYKVECWIKPTAKKRVIFDVPMAHSSRRERKVICLSTLNLEAAGTSETSSPTCQMFDSVYQKADILSSFQGDEGKSQLKILET